MSDLQDRANIGQRSLVLVGSVVLLLGVAALTFGLLGSARHPSKAGVLSGSVGSAGTVGSATPADSVTAAPSGSAISASRLPPPSTTKSFRQPKGTATAGAGSGAGAGGAIDPPGASSTPAFHPSRKPTSTKTTAARVPVAGPSLNLALHHKVAESSHTENYVAAHVTDGDVATYWEGQSGFPQDLTVDLGAVTTVGRIAMALPDQSNWNSRTQTIAVYASTDGESFHRIRAAAGYPFDADSAGRNTAAATLPATAARYVRLRFSANSGWPAAQLSELEVHSS